MKNMIEITKFLIDTKKIIKGRNLFDKSRNYNKKGCTVEIEGVTENILKELFAVIPFITTFVLKRLNLPEEANKDIVRNMIDILEEEFLS